MILNIMRPDGSRQSLLFSTRPMTSRGTGCVLHGRIRHSDTVLSILIATQGHV